MKKFNEFINESIRDLMEPKSEEEILKGFEGKSPFGTRAVFRMGDEDGPWDIPPSIEEEVKKAEKELDDIFEKYPIHSFVENVNLDKLTEDVIGWVEKYNGNQENLSQYGLKDLAAHLKEYAYSWRHDDYEVIYMKETVDTFLTLLKQMALDEVNNNNSDTPYMY